MNTKGLSLNTIPPLLIPMRFFLTAPLFGILAALLVIFYGADIWNSRWLPSALALTHLFTLGFMLMVMMGALYQFIPVMTGRLVPACKQLSPIIYWSLVLGVFTLVAGFLTHETSAFKISLLALMTSSTLFAFSLLPLLVTELKEHLIVYLLRILFVVLTVTIGIGLYMLLAYAFADSAIMFRSYTNIHASWGLIAWVVLLIMAVSSQIIPMFFVTPEFSTRYLKWSSLLLVGSMMMLFLIDKVVFLDNTLALLMQSLLSINLLFIIYYILHLMRLRKRKLPDVTINFFHLSLLSLLWAIIIWWLWQSGLNMTINISAQQINFTLAIIMIYGLAVSAIMGMLQKIVPFLIYINLQNVTFKYPQSMAITPRLVPNMKQIISNWKSKIQFYLHSTSYLFLLVSIYSNIMVIPAGLIMMLNFLWLSYCLFSGYFSYRQRYQKILQFPEMKMNFTL